MALTTTVSGSRVQHWEDKFFAEYVRASQFARLMGEDTNSPFQVNRRLQGASAGDIINFPLITRLTNSAVTGDNTMEGNEEALGNYNHQLTVNQRRNAVRVGKMEQLKTEVDYANAAKAMLKNWAVEDMRTQILDALGSPNVDGKTAHASCTAAQRNAWLTANSDRVLFGAAKSNASSLVWATAAATVDSTNDILQPNIISLAKRMAKTASPHIRPMLVDEQGEWYVLLANSLCFRDLKTHSTMTQANREAMERGRDNALFVDGDLMWDGVIVKEVPEIGVISGVGAGSPAIDIASNYLCGAQALGIGWAQTTKLITDTFDYENQRGVCISEIRGIEKLMFNSIQHGVLTIYCAAVADT